MGMVANVLGLEAWIRYLIFCNIFYTILFLNTNLEKVRIFC